MKGVMTEEQNNQSAENLDSTQSQDSDGQVTETQDSDTTTDSDIADDEDIVPKSFDYDLIQDEEDSEDEDYDNDKKKPNKAVEAINQMKLQTTVDSAVTKFFDDNPEAKEYRKRVEKFVKHPERMKFIKSGLPVEAVIAEALAPHLQRIGALKAKMADEEAARSKDGGKTATAKSPGSTDYSKMSSSEIRSLARDVKNGRYNK